MVPSFSSLSFPNQKLTGVVVFIPHAFDVRKKAHAEYGCTLINV